METIVHGGEEFVKVTLLAKKYRYTTDYIGQLCRAGKVEAKLVGRAWFVNEKSLVAHKSERYMTVRSNEIVINKSLVSDRSVAPVVQKRAVYPALSKNAHRNLLIQDPEFKHNPKTNFAQRIAVYQADNETLSPSNFAVKEIKKIEEKPQKIEVKLEENASRKLLFDELPEVTLSGNLAVDSLDDEQLFQSPEPVAISAISALYDSKIEKSPAKLPVLLTNRYQKPKNQLERTQKSELITSSQSEIKLPVVKNFTPATVRKMDLAKKTEINKNKNAQSRILLIPIFLLVSLLSIFTLFGLSSVVESNGLEFRQSTEFNLAAVALVLEKVSESY